MKAPKDRATSDLLEKPRRGRPKKDGALSRAEIQKAYRERQKEKTQEGFTVTLSNAEITAMCSMAQDAAREIAVRKLHGGPVRPEELKTLEWLSNLARKLGVAARS